MVEPTLEGPTEPAATPRRRGRWRSGEQSRHRILVAARHRFGQDGYSRTTLRAIAAEARVDPAAIFYYFGNKQQLFVIAMDAPDTVVSSLAAILDAGLDQLGHRLLAHFLQVWDAADDFEPLFALVRSASTHHESAMMLRKFIHHQIGARLIETLGTHDAELRVSLFGSQLVGLAVTRYLGGNEPISSADPQTLVRWMGPVLQGYLTGPPPCQSP